MYLGTLVWMELLLPSYRQKVQSLPPINALSLLSLPRWPQVVTNASKTLLPSCPVSLQPNVSVLQCGLPHDMGKASNVCVFARAA